MKTKQRTQKTTGETKPAITEKPVAAKPAGPPKYHLADVPQRLRARLLDLCFRRLYYDAMQLLEQNGFTHYTQDDLISFYHWAPNTLPGYFADPEPPPNVPRDYEQPSSEQVADIRARLADVPPDVMERVHDALKHAPIDEAGSLLWKAGVGLGSAELYEYRKTLFPPNALMDAYTSSPPVLRNPADGSADSLSAPSSATDNSPDDSQQLHEVRQRLVQILSARAQPPTDNGPLPEERENVRREEHEKADKTAHRSADSLSARPPTTTDNSEPRTLNPEPSALLATDHGHLLTELRDLINRYVVLPDMAAETLALWVVHTYAFTLRQVTTYIGVVSPEKRCGKTTLLELLALLANRALTAANISPSALFRVIQETSPTLLIDEADTFLQVRDELAGILNAGYRKGNAYVVRLSDSRTRRNMDTREPEFGEWTQDDGDDFAQYSCWCPKVMAAIGRLPDTLADRCILIAMQRKMPAEKCERMRPLNATEYRVRCAEFVRAHSDAIANARPEIPSALNDRAADIWEPLFAIADLAGGDWPELARQAALKLSGWYDDDMSLVGYLLKDIRTLILNRNADRILSREILAALNPRHDRSWEDLRRGREINEWWLGHKMSELGIRSKAMRVGDQMGKGYMLADVEAAFRRYVPNAEAQAVPGGSGG